jgi:hypothetical protein
LETQDDCHENEMMMKVVWHQSWHQSSKLMCNRPRKIELVKEGVGELSCWMKKVV